VPKSKNNVLTLFTIAMKSTASTKFAANSYPNIKIHQLSKLTMKLWHLFLKYIIDPAKCRFRPIMEFFGSLNKWNGRTTSWLFFASTRASSNVDMLPFPFNHWPPMKTYRTRNAKFIQMPEAISICEDTPMLWVTKPNSKTSILKDFRKSKIVLLTSDLSRKLCHNL